MTVNIVFSGTTYPIPSQAERNWATIVNAFFQGIAANALPKSGGNFTLAADLNLGSTGVVYVKALASNTAGIAASGFLKLAKTDVIAFRNTAGNGDLALGIDASDRLTFNGVAISTAAAAVNLTGAQTVSDKTLTNVAGITMAAGGLIDWAAGNASVGASIGINTLTLGGSGTSVYVAGILKSKIATTDDDFFYLNNDAALSGADWKGIIKRPTTGMLANATYTMPLTTTTVIGNDTTDTLTNKTLTSPAINTPTVSTPYITDQMDLAQVASPSAPSSGKTRIYSKTDGKIYKRPFGGIEAEIGSGGGLAGVAKTANYTASVNEMVEADATAGAFTVTLPTIPAAGGVIGVMDAGENASATNYIRVTPATGQSIGKLPVNDSYLIDYALGSLVLYAAAGATSWKIVYQTASMVQAGQLPGVTTGTTQTGAIGETGLNSGTAAPVSTGIYTVASVTLQPGLYLVTATCQLGFSTVPSITNLRFSLSASNNAFDGGEAGHLDTGAAAFSPSFGYARAVPTRLVRVTTATPYYLVGSMTFTGGASVSLNGELRWARIG